MYYVFEEELIIRIPSWEGLGVGFLKDLTE
jgi:hypothetical protein